MLQVWAHAFYEMTYHLRTLIHDLQGHISRRGTDAKRKYVEKQDQEHACLILKKVEYICEPYKMEQTLRRVHSAISTATVRPPDTLEKLLWEVQEVEGAI